jgi:ankyrin repeat protein
MIDCGLDLSIDGHTALFTAIMDGQYEMVEFLIEKGANPHLVCELLTSGEGNSLKALYYSSIEFAIHFRHLPILKLLLAKGVLPDQDGLPLAVEKEFEEAVALLSEFSDQHLPLKELLEDFLDRQQSNGRDIGLDFDIPHKGWAIFDSNMPKEAEKLADPSL